MYKILTITYTILSICIGCLFLYSAYSKTIPIQSFEYTIVEYVKFPWLLSAIAARFFIGLEAAMGVLLLLNIYGKRKWILKTAIVLTSLFSIYLIYLWSKFGNNVNCGCFGDAIWMNASSSLIKNVAIVLSVLLLLRFHKGIQIKWPNNFAPLFVLVIIIVPFFVFGIPDQKPEWLKKNSFNLNLTSIYDSTKAKPVPQINLSTGKHIVAFLSISCPHCRMAARKMHIMQMKNPALPFYFIIAGKKQYLQSFWNETNAENIPHTKLDGDSFTDLVGYSWPVIYWVNNDTVEANTNYITLNQDEIEQWINKP